MGIIETEFEEENCEKRKQEDENEDADANVEEYRGEDAVGMRKKMIDYEAKYEEEDEEEDEE